MSVDILEVGAQIVVEEPGHQALQHLYREQTLQPLPLLISSPPLLSLSMFLTAPFISLTFLYPPPIKIIKLNGQQLIIKND